MNILVLNAGSSSLKFQVIDTNTKDVLGSGNFERIGDAAQSFLGIKYDGNKEKFQLPANNHTEALGFIIEKLNELVLKGEKEINAVGHRIVHGGSKFVKPQLVDETVINGLKDVIHLAPLHNPAAIAGIEAVNEILPGVKSVVCFDTGFHQTMKETQYIYPIPYEYYEKYGIRKYGAHGISHEYVSKRIAEIKGNNDLKVINCHLGQGASLCAINKGICVDTSMGFTPAAGIPMGSRTGDIDPSVITFIMKEENLTPEEMNVIINKESGKKGISQLSADDRDLEEAMASGNTQAKLALDIFHYKVAQYIASYMVALGGCDVITFAGGIGERGNYSREEICKYLSCFGVKLDLEKNKVKAEEEKISSDDSSIEVWVVPTNEELMIALETEKLTK